MSSSLERGRAASLTPEDFADINNLLQQLDPESRNIDREIFREVEQSGVILIKRGETADESDRYPIVGMATILFVSQLRGDVAWIHDVVVHEAYRGRGIGEELLLALVEEGCRRGVPYIDLTSRPSRVAANALYAKIGFERRDTNVYRLRLDSQTTAG